MSFRTAVLALGLCFAAAAFAQPEKAPVTVDAQTIEGVGDIEVTARGKAEIRRDDTSIFGEVLRYNRELGRVQGEGGVRLQQGLDRFFGPRLEYNTLDSTGVFEEPGFLLQRELPARGRADRLEFVGRDHYRLRNASFTTCKPGQDDWMLTAEELDLNYAQDEGVARGVRLRFFDVPIFGTPYVSFPLESKRRSGILTPYYSQTSTRGAEIGVPYYWNIAPERDATITPVYMARRGVQLKNHVRFMEADYAGEFRLEYLPDDRVFGQTREGMSLQHEHAFGPNLRAQVDYNRVSDDRYFVDLASQVRQLTTRNLPFDANLTYNGFVGDAPYTAQARVQRFQTLQDPLAPIVAPYQRVPQIRFNAANYGAAGFFDSALPAEFVRFEHPSLVQATRVSTNPTLAGAFVAPGWYITPKVGVRAASWALDRQPVTDPGSAKAAIPWYSLDSGLVFERDSTWFDRRFTQTLEPRLFYVRVPFHRQDHIPLFDTTLADFNYPQLFTENRFVGGDRFGDAHQMTLAVSSRFLRDNGQEAFRATLGQRYYFEDERVALTPATPLRTASDSDILASVGGRVFRHWTFDATTQYNRHADHAERYNASVRYNPEIAKVVNFTYRFNRAAIKQLDLSTQWPVAAGWYGVARYNYSLLDKRLLEGLAGIEYNAGCWIFRAVVQRIQAISNVPTSQLLFQLEFNGVGQLGTDEAVELLKRNVPGYAITNPHDTSLAPPGARPRLPFPQVF
ncbi:MAG: LPS-assembly protein LptD [Betaproteobacteria bacterium]